MQQNLIAESLCGPEVLERQPRDGLVVVLGQGHGKFPAADVLEIVSDNAIMIDHPFLGSVGPVAGHVIGPLSAFHREFEPWLTRRETAWMSGRLPDFHEPKVADYCGFEPAPSRREAAEAILGLLEGFGLRVRIRNGKPTLGRWSRCPGLDRPTIKCPGIDKQKILSYVRPYRAEIIEILAERGEG